MYQLTSCVVANRLVISAYLTQLRIAQSWSTETTADLPRPRIFVVAGPPGSGKFATLDLISRGRAKIVAGRGSLIEPYPLFGLRLEDYDSHFAEKLDLLLKIRPSTQVDPAPFAGRRGRGSRIKTIERDVGLV